MSLAIVRNNVATKYNVAFNCGTPTIIYLRISKIFVFYIYDKIKIFKFTPTIPNLLGRHKLQYSYFQVIGSCMKHPIFTQFSFIDSIPSVMVVTFPISLSFINRSDIDQFFSKKCQICLSYFFTHPIYIFYSNKISRFNIFLVHDKHRVQIIMKHFFPPRALCVNIMSFIDATIDKSIYFRYQRFNGFFLLNIRVFNIIYLTKNYIAGAAVPNRLLVIIYLVCHCNESLLLLAT